MDSEGGCESGKRVRARRRGETEGGSDEDCGLILWQKCSGLRARASERMVELESECGCEPEKREQSERGRACGSGGC